MSGDIANRHSYTEVERRAWCVLKGVTLKALKDDMAKRERLDVAERRASAIAELERKAKGFGLKVIKARKPVGSGSVHAARLLKPRGI